VSIKTNAHIVAKWIRLGRVRNRFIKIRTHINKLKDELELGENLYEFIDYEVYEALDDAGITYIIYSINESEHV